MTAIVLTEVALMSFASDFDTRIIDGVFVRRKNRRNESLSWKKLGLIPGMVDDWNYVLPPLLETVVEIPDDIAYNDCESRA